MRGVLAGGVYPRPADHKAATAPHLSVGAAPALPTPNRIGIRHIAFAVDDIEALVSRLNDEGVSFFSEVRTYPATGKKLVYCRGPEGIILEFAQYR